MIEPGANPKKELLYCQMQVIDVLQNANTFYEQYQCCYALWRLKLIGGGIVREWERYNAPQPESEGLMKVKETLSELAS